MSSSALISHIIVALLAFMAGGTVGFMFAAIIAAANLEPRDDSAAAPTGTAAGPEEGSALWI